MKSQQEKSRKQEDDNKFHSWLSPSNWLVEAQLHLFRQQRGEGTLEWARNMKEFETWRFSDTESNERILWIRGTLGIGKSTLAAYYIDLLKFRYPDSIVAYFFCRSEQNGLTKAQDIIRTLAYQCAENDPDARGVLQGLQKKNLCLDENLGISFMFEQLLLEPLK